MTRKWKSSITPKRILSPYEELFTLPFSQGYSPSTSHILYYSSICSFTHPLRLSLIFILSLSFFHSHSFIFILLFSFLHFHSFIFIISFIPFSFFLFSSLDFEECAHKLLKMQLKDEQLVNYPLFAFCRLSHRTKFHSRP